MRGLQILFLVLATGLASCGFTPVYAPGSESAANLSDIRIAAPRNEQGYLFVREMEERLGRNSQASKFLKFNITIRGEGVESETERRRFVGAVSYELLDIRSQAVLARGSVDSFTGYSVSGGLIVSARQDAVQRLVVILADKLVQELIVKLAKP